MKKAPNILLKAAALFVCLSLVSAVAAQTKRIKPLAEHQFFKCKALINPSTGQTIPNAVIETNGGKILRVGSASEITIPSDAKVMDYSDKYVIPGLIDTHGHLYGRLVSSWHTTDSLLATFYLAAGVTSIGDPGSMDPAGDLALRNRIDSGQFLGPRYFLAGEYIEMDPAIVGWMNPVHTPEEARLKVDMWAMQGISAIKVYADTKGEILQAAIDEAHEHSLRVWGHVGATSFQEAMDMGLDQLFHGVLAMSDGRPPDSTQAKYEAWMKETAELDLTKPEIQKMFQTAAQRHVVLTPTAAVSESFASGKALYDAHHMDEQKKYYTAAGWDTIQKYLNSPPPPPFSVEGIEKEVKKNEEFIRRAHDAGCLLSTGTDYVLLTTLPGWTLWREMDIFAEAGVPPMDILKAATWNGAYAVGRTDQLGSIEAGKLADFVFLNANPLDNISNVRSVYRVVKGGVVYEPEKLLKPLEGKVD